MLIKNGKVVKRYSAVEEGVAKMYVREALEKGKCDFVELLYSHRTWEKK
jgi:hypothetical protein